MTKKYSNLNYLLNKLINSKEFSDYLESTSMSDKESQILVDSIEFVDVMKDAYFVDGDFDVPSKLDDDELRYIFVKRFITNLYHELALIHDYSKDMKGKKLKKFKLDNKNVMS